MSSNNNELAVREQTELDAGLALEVLVKGDLSRLTEQQKLQYYYARCESAGLDPRSRPFDYIVLNGKLTLYANKGAAEQVRNSRGINIDKPDIQFDSDLCIVTVTGTDRTGRMDSDVGIVPVGELRGEARANAIMKAITKGKRRLTLSICGLNMLDETEVDSIPAPQAIRAVNVATGELGGGVRIVEQRTEVAAEGEEDPDWLPVAGTPNAAELEAGKPASAQQLKAIADVAGKKRVDPRQWAFDNFDTELESLNQGQAGKLIKLLQKAG